MSCWKWKISDGITFLLRGLALGLPQPWSSDPTRVSPALFGDNWSGYPALGLGAIWLWVSELHQVPVLFVSTSGFSCWLWDLCILRGDLAKLVPLTEAESLPSLSHSQRLRACRACPTHRGWELAKLVPLTEAESLPSLSHSQRLLFLGRAKLVVHGVMVVAIVVVVVMIVYVWDGDGGLLLDFNVQSTAQGSLKTNHTFKMTFIGSKHKSLNHKYANAVDCVSDTNAVRKKGEDFEKMKVNGLGTSKVEQGKHFWQWAKHAWIYYFDLLQVFKGKHLSALSSPLRKH